MLLPAAVSLLVMLGLQVSVWVLYGIPPMQRLHGPDGLLTALLLLAVCTVFHCAYNIISFKVRGQRHINCCAKALGVPDTHHTICSAVHSCDSSTGVAPSQLPPLQSAHAEVQDWCSFKANIP